MAEGCCGCAATFDGRSVAYRRVLLLVIVMNAVMFVVELAAGYLALAGAASRCAGFPRRHGDLLDHAPGHRPSRRMAGESRRFQRPEPRRAGAVGGGIDRVARVPGRHAGADDDECHRRPRAVRQRQRRRCSTAFATAMRTCARRGCAAATTRSATSRSFCGGGVWATDNSWPDLVVALAMSTLFVHSSIRIVRQARVSWGRSSRTKPVPRSRSKPILLSTGHRIRATVCAKVGELGTQACYDHCR